MSFLFPSFLVAMAILALPIVLHFWNIRRAKKQFFSNITLLKRVSTLTNKASKLKHLLLLSARLLFLFFLTVAFAKLYNSNSLTSNIPTDRSRYKIDASCSVISNQDTKAKLTSFLQKIGSEQEGILQDCYSSITHLSDFLQEDTKELILLSDFQKEFIDLNEIAEESGKITFVHLTNNLKRPNVFVDSLWLEEQYFKANEKNIVWIKLRNTGDSDASDILIELKADGKTIASQITSVPQKEDKKLSFQILGQFSKPILCSAVINDGSWDFDNIFSFVFTPVKNLNITLITDQQANNPIKIAYDQEAIFQCRVTKSSLSSDEMEKSDLLLFQKETEPSKTEILQILADAKRGKTLAILPSLKWSKATFELINAELGVTAYLKWNTERDSIQELDKLDVSNPFLSKIFTQVPNLAQLPFVAPVCALKGADEVILRTKDGNPALSLYEIGRGKLFAFSFGLNERETFSRDAIFLPILYRIAESSIVNTLPYYLRQDKKQIVLKRPTEEVDKVYSLSNSETRIVTEQKVMGNKVLLNLPDNMSMGFWHVIDKQNDQLASFGYNLNKAESDMQFYSFEELSNKYKGNKNITVVKLEDLNKLLSKKEKGDVSKIWRYVVGISFLFLLFEIMVARFYKRNNAAIV